MAMEIDIEVDEAVDDGSTLFRVTMSEAGLQIVFNMTWDEAHELRTGLAKAMIAARLAARFPDLTPPEPPKPETMDNVVSIGKPRKRPPKEPS